MWVHDRLAASVQRWPQRPALCTAQGCWTYSELDHRVQALARRLVEWGVRPGERVAIDLGNQDSAVVAIWAALRAGGAFACLDPATPASTWSELIEDFRPRVVLTRAARLREAVPPAGCIGVVAAGETCGVPPSTATFDREASSSSSPTLAAAWRAEADPRATVANVVFTSGSTGRPKGVVMSHAAVGAAADAIAGYLRLQHDDVVLDVLPLSFDYGLYQALLCATVGACLVLEPGFGYAGSLLRSLRDRRITTLPGVPSLFQLLLQRPSFDSRALPALRRFTNTGSHLPRADVHSLRQRFPVADLYLMYGVTECKRVSYLPPELADAHPESVGLPMPGCQVQVVDDEGRVLGPDRVGELVVRGTTMMTGYWNNPAATAAALRPGPWPGERCLWTGDLFRRDEQGLLYFVGRRDDVFKCRGEKVAPAEVERVLCTHAGVLAAAVMPAEDPALGTRIHAFVVPAPGTTLDRRSLRLHCARRLEPHKVPHRVHLLDQLPRDARGKVDRSALRALLEPSDGAAPLQQV